MTETRPGKPFGDRIIHDTVKQTRIRSYKTEDGSDIQSETGVYGMSLLATKDGKLVLDMRPPIKIPPTFRNLKSSIPNFVDRIGDRPFRVGDDNFVGVRTTAQEQADQNPDIKPTKPLSYKYLAKRRAKEVLHALSPVGKPVWEPHGYGNLTDNENPSYPGKDHYRKRVLKIPNPRRALQLLVDTDRKLTNVFSYEPKRQRGNADQIAENARRLGLGEIFKRHKWGIEVTDPTIYSKGVSLHDIFRNDKLKTPVLNNIDRFEALTQATTYIRDMHINYGHIGEALLADIIFRDVDSEKGTVSNPILNVPDIVTSHRATQSETEQRANDILDFMICAATQEYRLSGNWDNVQKAMNIITEAYGDDRVLSAANSFLKRGRVIMQKDGTKGAIGKEFAGRLHNNIRLGISEIPFKERGKLRDMAMKELTPYARSHAMRVKIADLQARDRTNRT